MAKNKTKILWYSDSPVIETGFAQVAKQILGALHNTGKYDIEVIGVEHFFDDYDKEKYPYKIHLAPEHDHYQSELLAKRMQEGDFDILFTFHNLGIISQYTPWIVQAKQKYGFKWINYSPIDCETMQPLEVVPLYYVDIPVVYTQFAKRVCLSRFSEVADKIKVIYHGTEPEEFRPLKQKDKLKKELFGLDPEIFLVTNVNRNQWRKHLGATIAGFKKFKEMTKARARLYLHCKVEDAGGDITRLAANFGLTDEDLILSQIDSEMFGVSRDKMNEIYNASDVIVSTTLGEGWGLSTTEAMCAGVPFLGPRNSSLVEIIGEDEERGYLSKMTDQWIVPYGHANIPYYLLNIDHFAHKLKHIYEGRDVERKTKAAREWTLKHTWEDINKQWLEVFSA